MRASHSAESSAAHQKGLAACKGAPVLGEAGAGFLADTGVPTDDLPRRNGECPEIAALPMIAKQCRQAPHTGPQLTQ